MERARQELDDTRARTNASLNAERISADADTLRQSIAQRVLDDLIEKDRGAAEQRLLKARQVADDLLVQERAVSPAANSTVVLERSQSDAGKRDERAATDAVLEEEHRGVEALVRAAMEGQQVAREHLNLHRRWTDRQLSSERTGADNAVVALGESEQALADSQTERARSRDVFGMVTHDLRNPLSVITLQSEILAQGTPDPSTREIAEDISRAAARMDRLLTDLMDVARIENAALGLHASTHEVRSLLTDVLRTYEPLFAARGLVLSVAVPENPLPVRFDYDRIVQVLSNLLGNAMKFAGPSGNVRLRVGERAGEVEFALKDSGPGIDPAALPRIFDRFWQLDKAARRGLGLGLYISKSIVEAHGGRIWAESVLGQGATFRFTLPTGTPTRA